MNFRDLSDDIESWLRGLPPGIECVVGKGESLKMKCAFNCYYSLKNRVRTVWRDVRWVLRNVRPLNELAWLLPYPDGLNRRKLGVPLLLAYRQKLVVAVDPKRITRRASREELEKMRGDFVFEEDHSWKEGKWGVIDERNGGITYNGAFLACITDTQVLEGEKGVGEIDEVVALKTQIENKTETRVNGKIIESPETLERILENYVSLACDIKVNGYNPKKVKRHIGVAIDRTGEFIKYTDGRHRLIIAEALGLSTVPVEIRAVHRKWLEACIKKHGGSATHALLMGLSELEGGM